MRKHSRPASGTKDATMDARATTGRRGRQRTAREQTAGVQRQEKRHVCERESRWLGFATASNGWNYLHESHITLISL